MRSCQPECKDNYTYPALVERETGEDICYGVPDGTLDFPPEVMYTPERVTFPDVPVVSNLRDWNSQNLVDGSNQTSESIHHDASNGTTADPSVNTTSTTSKKKDKSTKPRLVCPHPGCKHSFPRKYELKRHQENIHNRNLALLCNVYGCNRASKPFGRLDKLMEHQRKHQNPDKLLCPIETCRTGP